MVESFIHALLNAPINGILNEKRSIKEIEKWWGIPFIVTDTVEDIGDPALMDRLSEWSNIKINDRETWEAMVRVVFQRNKAFGSKAWMVVGIGRPNTRHFGTIDEAVEYVRNM